MLRRERPSLVPTQWYHYFGAKIEGNGSILDPTLHVNGRVNLFGMEYPMFEGLVAARTFYNAHRL